MTKCIGAALLILPTSLWAVSPDTIQLKENAAITGRILALRHRDAFAYDNENPNNPYRYLEPPRRMRKAAIPP